MNKNAQVYRRKGRGRKVLGVILVIMTLMMVFAVFNASADTWGNYNNRYSLSMTIGGTKNGDTYTSSFSTDDIVAFGADKIFTVNEATRIKYIRVESDKSNKDVQLNTSDDRWKKTKDSRTIYEYSSGNSISKDEIQVLFNMLSVKLTSTSAKSGELTITVYCGEQSNGSSRQRYSGRAKITFYQFARGSTSGEVVTSYSTADGNSKSISFVDNTYDGTGANSAAVPNSVNEGANATFGIRITNTFGGAKNKVGFGYQVKKSSDTWENTETIIPAWITKSWSGWVDLQGEYEEWNSRDKIAWLKVDRLDSRGTRLEAGVDYDVRGVIVTDDFVLSANYTEPFRVRYDKPVINSFNIGSLLEAINGGTNRIATLSGVFNNTTYDNKEYGSRFDLAYGASLDIKAEITTNFQTGTVVNGVAEDQSPWEVADTTTWYAQDQNHGTNATQFNRNINEALNVTFKNTIDSNKVALKVTVTDVRSGYSTFYITDTFTVDSNPPTDPIISAVDEDEEVMNLANQDYTVGGANAAVNLLLSGSGDSGSGLKEYSYMVYYVSTEAASRFANTSSTQAILQQMANYTPESFGEATFTNWTSLKPDAEGKARFTVSKDGYYRIISKAADNSGKFSKLVEQAFRVDLSIPATPETRLVANNKTAGGSANNLVAMPYDNRTYTDSEVWMLVKIPPMTGKTIKDYEFSLDNGLEWLEINSTAKEKYPGMTVLGPSTANVYYTKDGQTDSSGNPVLPYNPNYLESFAYDIAVRLDPDGADGKGGISDYQSIVMRIKDSYGNTSLVSEAVVMRTTADISTGDVLHHEGIEVALSLGITTKSAGGVSPQLKNAAAKKINEKYYGLGGQSNPNEADFNPWLLAKDHTCRWDQDKDPDCVGPCLDGANCPYVKYGDLYEYYRPQQVNVQGLSNQNAAMRTDWAEYDHNTTSTGAMIGTKGTYHASTYDLTDAAIGRVRGGTTGNTSSNGTNANPVYQTYVYSGAQTNCAYRSRHFIDYSTESGAVAAGTEGPFGRILAMGYANGQYRDWKFLPDDQPGKKTLQLTIDEASASFHTYDGGGFFFNTTIRKNSAGTWVISGYLFYNGTGGGTTITDPFNVSGSFSSMILKFTEVPVLTFADGSGSRVRGHAGVTEVAVLPYPDTSAAVGGKVKNFKIVTEAGYTSVWWTMGTGNHTDAAFKLFENTASTDTTINGVRGGRFFNNVATPRVTVNGVDPGQNSYGFGPLIGYLSHSCGRETRVEFSNINMIMQVARRLSEVVTEPQWGGGKAKYILNISDQSADDFNDAALSSAIQWRLFNDSAKFVGWGKEANRATTEEFLSRIEGEGYYESNDVGKNDQQQIDGIAEYITRAYYKEFGFTEDQINSGTIKDAVTAGVSAKGTVYSLDDVGSHEFTVTPDFLNTSTANEDFPAGRWFIQHDTIGYENVNPSPRNNKYSDALDLKITQPGRYTVYFAPDPVKAASNTLDPDKDGAIFDFVVSQRPVANFTGTIDKTTNVVTVDDSPAIDLDAPTTTPMAQGYYFKNESGVDTPYNSFPTATDVRANANIQLNGIKNVEWRYEILTTNGTGNDISLDTKYSSGGWISSTPGNNPITGKTVTQLTSDRPVPITSLGDNDVLTVYMRVTDTSAVKKAAYDGQGRFLGYYYVPGETLTSKIVQQNVTSGAAATFSPLSSFQLSTVYMYDTALAGTANSKILVTRKSSQSQGKEFNLSWAINFTGGKDDYIQLTKDATTGDYKDGAEVVLKCETPENVTAGGSTGGVWSISKDYISKHITQKGGNMVLQITESLMGLTTEDIRNNVSTPHNISDSSARAIFYMADTNPPSIQNVDVITKTWTGEAMDNPPMEEAAKWTTSTYEASKYLDVTKSDKYLELTIGGSKDAEGRLGGYAYYLYSKNPDGTVKDYYKLNADGTKSAPTTAASATTTITYDNTMASDEVSQTLKLTSKVMASTGSSESISIAIWAFDNANPVNKTVESKVEDMKFSKSIPVAPAITVTDDDNAVVSTIGNDNGFTGLNATDDKMNSPSGKNFFSATPVTVKFAPRQGYFVTDDTTGEQVPAAADAVGARLFYMDVNKFADRTNMATIHYTGERISTNGTHTPISGTIDPARELRFEETGEYEITAKVVNGANAESATRTLSFKIDRGIPTTPTLDVLMNLGGREQPYDGSWQRSVTIDISGSRDIENNSTSHYRYSIDGGNTWTDMPNNLSTGRELSFTEESGIKTGSYEVRIVAVDPAGNTSEEKTVTINIDLTAPTVPLREADVTASSKVVYNYAELLVKTSILGEGTAWPQGSTDTDVAIPVSLENGKLVSGMVMAYDIVPASGYELASVMFGSKKYIPGSVSSLGYLIASSKENGAYVFMPPSVVIDPDENPHFEETFVVEFVEKDTTGKVTTVLKVPEEVSVPNYSVIKPLAAYVPGTSEPGISGNYRITVSHGGAGTFLDPSSGSVEVLPASSKTVSVIALPGVKLSSITINGGTVDLDNLPAGDFFTMEGSSTYKYTFGEVFENKAIAFNFVTREVYELYLNTTGRGGTLVFENLSDRNVARTGNLNSNGAYEVFEGATLQLRPTPQTDYALKAFSVNDRVYEADSDLITIPQPYEYTVTREKDAGGILATADFGIASGATKVGISVQYLEKIEKDPENSEEPDPENPEEPEPEPKVVLKGGTIWPTPETSGENEIIYVPSGATQTFTVTLYPGYTLEDVKIIMPGRGGVSTETSLPLTPSNDGKTVTFTAHAINGASDGSDVGLTLFFKEKTFSVLQTVGTGGRLLSTVVDRTGTPIDDVNFDAIPEGASIQFTVEEEKTTEATSGYRLSDVQVNSASIGARSSFSLDNIKSNQTVKVDFTKRPLLDSFVSHTISIVANNVSDNAALADRPYYFAIYENGETPQFYGPFAENMQDALSLQAQGMPALKPNCEYNVRVKAVDRVGNEGVSPISKIYTRANQAFAINAQVADGQNDSYTKKVWLYINPNGNPSNTEYLVRYSEYETMKEVFSAKREENGEMVDDWKPLAPGGYLEVSGLEAGKPYFLTVDSRNTSGIITDASYLESNIRKIVLSHAAPPEASIYFTEQKSPFGGTTLIWDEPPSDVSGIVIYRDGEELEELEKELHTSFTDDSTYALLGNKVYGYSYAYRNSAGVGSTRTVVSEAYRDAYKKSLDVVDESGTIVTPGDPTDLNKLKALIKSQQTEDQQTFEQLLTYPHYPASATVSFASIMSTSGTDYNSGRVVLKINPDTSTTSRSQKYRVKLIGGNMVGGEFVPDTGYNDSMGSKLEGETTFLNSRDGATHQWDGLNTELVYEVQVLEVITSGPVVKNNSVVVDAADGSNYGIEGSLGKIYRVDRDGYSVEFTKDSTAAGLLYPSGTSWEWSGNEGDAYADPQGTHGGWDRMLTLTNAAMVGIDYIKFNTAPKIALPTDPADYFDEQLTYDAENGYILIDGKQKDPKFKVNVAVWDTDSASLSVEGRIDGYLAGRGSIISPLDRQPITKDEYYRLEMDGNSLKSGVYDSIDLTANDTELISNVKLTDENLKIVVNQIKPNITVRGGTQTRKIQLGADFKDVDFSVASSINKGNSTDERIRTLRITILEEEFERIFGTNDEAALRNNLTNGLSEPYLSSVRELLGTNAGTYLNGNKAKDAASVNAIIDSVNPPLRYMVGITKNQYEAATEQVRTEHFRKEDIGSGDTMVSYYWADYDYAVSNSLCTWIERNEVDGEDVIIGTLKSTYDFRVYAKFGNNESQITPTFQVESVPSVVMRTNASWGWYESLKAEYDFYEEGDFRIADVAGAKIFNGAYDDMLDAKYLSGESDDGYSDEAHSEVAYKAEQAEDPNNPGTMITKYYVYKMNDTEMAVGKNYLTASMDVTLGVHEAFFEAGMILTTSPTYNPNTGTGLGEGVVESGPIAVQNGGITKNGVYTSTMYGLTAGTTYYIWTFYNTDPGKDESHRVYRNQGDRITTSSDLQTAYYGFTFPKTSYLETNARTYSDGYSQYIQIDRRGDDTPKATVSVSAKYFLADDEGNFVLDNVGERIPIEFDVGNGAGDNPYRTFVPVKDTIDFKTLTQSFDQVEYKLYNNSAEQHHMIAELSISLSDMIGCNYVQPGAETTLIYIQDDESPIKEYKMGLINNTEDELEDLIAPDARTSFYRYKFEGLDLGVLPPRSLTIGYENTSTGDLNNITVEIFKDRTAKELSDEFYINGDYTDSLLSKTMGGYHADAKGYLNILPASDLSDGMHRAYVRIKDSRMTSDNDNIWIEVTQIVGQSTLSGYIYYSKNMPLTEAMLLSEESVATVKLYNANDFDGTGMPTADPLYTATTDPHRSGYFEIKNILNLGMEGAPDGYFIVVEKPGFIPYSSGYYGIQGTAIVGQYYEASKFKLQKESHKYQFNVRLLAGDVNRDYETNEKDFTAFMKNFNKSYDAALTDQQLADMGLENIRYCDYNFDGLVNVLDRMSIREVVGLSMVSYDYLKTYDVNQPMTNDTTNGGIPVDQGMIS